MATSRKRKHAVDVATQSKHNVSQKGIQAFGAIGKAHLEDGDSELKKKRKTGHERQATPQAVEQTPVAKPQAHRKRKRQLDAIAEEEDDDGPQPTTTGDGNARIFKQFARRSDATPPPRQKRFKNALPPSPKDTPTKGTLSLFDRLNLRSSSPSIPSSPSKRHDAAYDTPPLTPDDDESLASEPNLPQPLNDLYNLHAAFLTSLSLYHAHNGASSAVEIHMLLPMITRSWKRRAVTLEDLRRILAVGETSFTIQDRGRAGLCLCPAAQPRGRTVKRATSFTDERAQNRQFEDALAKSYVHWQAKTSVEAREPQQFIAQLPLAAITQTESSTNLAPIFARGQQRLADLKASQAAAHAAPTLPSQTPQPTTTASTTTPTPSSSPSTRGTALLNRILAKSSTASHTPRSPSAAQLARTTALHRIPATSATLLLLAGSSPSPSPSARSSFSFHTVVQTLQQSFRSPISRDEVATVLGLMSAEVCPEFLRLVESGGVKGVVVLRGGWVGREELARRLRGLGCVV